VREGSRGGGVCSFVQPPHPPGRKREGRFTHVIPMPPGRKGEEIPRPPSAPVKPLGGRLGFYWYRQTDKGGVRRRLNVV